MSSCLFCQIASGTLPARIVYEESDFLAFWDLHPVRSVHLLVIPRLHIASLYDLKTEHASLMGRLLCAVPQIAREAGLVNGFRTIVNTGHVGGQEIHHVHVHIIGDINEAVGPMVSRRTHG